MRVLSFPELETPPEWRAQVRNLQAEAWPSAGVSAADQWAHDPALKPRSMLLVEAQEVLACLDILSKHIVHAGRRYHVGGLSTVVTRRSVRGRGYGCRLVAAAREAMPTLGMDLGLFTCDRPLRRFYERAGWQLLRGTVVVGGTPDAPFRSDQPGFDKVTMAAFFSPTALNGRGSFYHARIELYPGDIDKLW